MGAGAGKCEVQPPPPGCQRSPVIQSAEVLPSGRKIARSGEISVRAICLLLPLPVEGLWGAGCLFQLWPCDGGRPGSENCRSNASVIFYFSSSCRFFFDFLLYACVCMHACAHACTRFWEGLQGRPFLYPKLRPQISHWAAAQTSLPRRGCPDHHLVRSFSTRSLDFFSLPCSSL